jgi:hypothetical protein
MGKTLELRRSMRNGCPWWMMNSVGIWGEATGTDSTALDLTAIDGNFTQNDYSEL